MLPFYFGRAIFRLSIVGVPLYNTFSTVSLNRVEQKRQHRVGRVQQFGEHGHRNIRDSSTPKPGHVPRAKADNAQ